MSPDKMSRTKSRGQNVMVTKYHWTKCRGQNALEMLGSKCCGQNVVDKMSWTKCCGQNVLVKMSWSKCRGRNVVVNMFWSKNVLVKMPRVLSCIKWVDSCNSCCSKTDTSVSVLFIKFTYYTSYFKTLCRSNFISSCIVSVSVHVRLTNIVFDECTTIHNYTCTLYSLYYYCGCRCGYRLAVGVLNWVPEQLNIKAVNWSMQVDWWLQSCAVFGHSFSGFSWHMPQTKVDSIAWLYWRAQPKDIVSYTLYYIPSTDWALYCWCRLGNKDIELETLHTHSSPRICSLNFVHKIDQNILTTTFLPCHFVHDILSTTFCPWPFVRDILSTIFCPRYLFPRHFGQWHFVHITYCPRHFVRDILSGDILSGHPYVDFIDQLDQFIRRPWMFVYESIVFCWVSQHDGAGAPHDEVPPAHRNS